MLYSFQQKAFCQSSLRWRVQCIYKLGYPSSKIVDINMKLITGNIFSWGEFRRYLLRITLNQNWNRTPPDKETEVSSLSEDKETTGQAQNLANWRDGPKQPIKIREGKLDRTITIFSCNFLFYNALFLFFFFWGKNIQFDLNFTSKHQNTIGYLVSILNFLIDSGCVFIQNASTVLTLWLKSAAVSRRFFDLQKLKLSKCLSLSHTQPQEHDQQHP